MFDEPTSEQCDLATRLVKRRARDRRDEAELLAMLGLDHTEAAPPAHRPHGPLSQAELQAMLAPVAAERATKNRGGACPHPVRGGRPRPPASS
ncbi:hypothetical protein MUY14_08175 [Amycolatopsis sp. FBCC-B4732]|uniref:hypothetical protein n=1 Tax=Amycolatopsis sp. FBCC-B4732 TaxID=3079339 RepID=UPI001FF31DF2|nr:hypothetical protein [Amycolatopsis sp. FBCC-B4732]UOX90588.1 hypothetical protein MUY14_08175 [Amycolatopsis sp. FBCC-B4732]